MLDYMLLDVYSEAIPHLHQSQPYHRITLTRNLSVTLLVATATAYTLHLQLHDPHSIIIC